MCCLGALRFEGNRPIWLFMTNETHNPGSGPAGRADRGRDSRSWTQAVARGLRKKCPECGRGSLFSGYTTINENCSHCGLALDGHQADDAPPYLTILIVGHITIPLALAVKQAFEPPLWMQFAIWLPVILIASFLFLPIAKGAMVGLQWANYMHGFSGSDADPAADA